MSHPEETDDVHVEEEEEEFEDDYHEAMVELALSAAQHDQLLDLLRLRWS